MNPLTDLPHILIWEYVRTKKMFLAWIKSSQLGTLTFTRKLGFQTKLDSPERYCLLCALNVFELKHGWFHLMLYSVFRDLSRRSIGTGFWRFSDAV